LLQIEHADDDEDAGGAMSVASVAIVKGVAATNTATHTATHCAIAEGLAATHSATHCNTLQYNAARCNLLMMMTMWVVR